MESLDDKLTIRITGEDRRRVEELAQAERMSVSVWIRHAILVAHRKLTSAAKGVRR